MNPFDPPRWPGGPPICSEANLPAFRSTKAAGQYIQRYCPSVKLIAMKRCRGCKHIHFYASVSKK